MAPEPLTAHGMTEIGQRRIPKPAKPEIVISYRASDDIRNEIIFYYTLLQANPTDSLQSLAEFKANPNALPEDAPWHKLTSRSSEVCRYHEFDESFEDDIINDPGYVSLLTTSRNSGDKQPLYIRRMELYLERLADLRTLGASAIAGEGELAA